MQKNALWEEDSYLSNNSLLLGWSLSFVTGWMGICSAFDLQGWGHPGKKLSSLWWFESERHLYVTPHEEAWGSLFRCYRRIRIIKFKNWKGPKSPTAYKSHQVPLQQFQWRVILLLLASFLWPKTHYLEKMSNPRYPVSSYTVNESTSREIELHVLWAHQKSSLQSPQIRTSECI